MANPQELYDRAEALIFDFVFDYMDSRRVRVTKAAVNALLRPGRSYKFNAYQVTSIDREMLHRALDEFLDNAYRSNGVIDQDGIRIAFKNTSCHYLWFC
jgi:hypothetical protein